MSNLATVTPIRPQLSVVERQVADLDDGYARIANELLEAYSGANITKRHFKVLLAVLRKTYGWNKPMDRISDSQIAEIANLPVKRCNEAKLELVRMGLLKQCGGMFGPNKNMSEWRIPQIEGKSPKAMDIPQTEGKSLKIGDKTSLNLGDGNPSKQGDTKDTIQKKERQLPPTPQGEGAGQEIKPVQKKSPAVDYQAVLSAYNTTLGDRLPQAEALSDKRRKAIKRLMGELKEPTIDAVTNYFATFGERAKPFYFGDNDTGWRASFDYLLRSETLIKTREGSL